MASPAAAEPCNCLADLTGDGNIDGRDVQLFVDCALQGTAEGACACGDMNGTLAIEAGDNSPTGDTALFVQALLNATGACGPTRRISEPGPQQDPIAVPSHNPHTGAGPLTETGPRHQPVYGFSGEFHHTAVDLTIRGRGFDFIWGRRYRSRLGTQTAMGNNWVHTYDIRVEQDSGGLLLFDGNSRCDRYGRDPGSGLFIRDEFFRHIALQPGNAHHIVFPHLGRWETHPFDGTPQEGKLAAIVNRNGNAMSFEYDSFGRLTLISDTLHDPTGNARQIQVAYNSDGFIHSITDFENRQVQYEYYQNGDAGGSFGDLKSVRSPIVAGTPNGNDFGLGKTTVYTYTKGFSDERLNHDLLTITDPKGQTYLVNTYAHTVGDGNFRHTTDPLDPYYDRLVRQEHGDPGDTIDYVYETVVPNAGNGFAAIRMIENDRVGNVEEFLYDDLNRLVVHREYTGRWDPDQPTTNLASPLTPKLRLGDPDFFETRKEYNADSLCTRIVHPNGNEEQFTYDELNASRRSQRNLLQHCRLPGPLGGDQATICETFAYDDDNGGCCGTNFVTDETDGRNNTTVHTYDANGNRLQTTHRITSIIETYEYDAFGRLTAHVLPDNGSGNARRDEFFYYGPIDGAQNGYRSDRVEDFNGFALTTSYTYDNLGNVTSRVDPEGNETIQVFNELDQVVQATSPEVATGGPRYTRDIFYDANDNVVRIDVENIDDQGTLQPNSHFTTVFEYDILDQTTRACREHGSYTGSIPGPPELPTCTGLPVTSFQTVESEYDANRNQILQRNGEATNGNQPGNEIAYAFDERDLLFEVSRGPGATEQSTDQTDYDGNGNLTLHHEGLEDAPRVTAYTYDGFNRVTASTDAMGNVRTAHYDANSNRVSERTDGELTDDPGGLQNIRLAETTYAYDAMDRLTIKGQNFFDPATQLPINVGPTPDGVSANQYTWSDNSQILQVTDDNLHQTTTSYDSANRVLTVTDARNNSTTYAYDAASRLTTVTEVEKSDLGFTDETYTTTYTYDGLNRLTSTTDNISNSHQYAYDSRNNHTQTIDALLHETRYAYDGLDRLTRTTIDLDGDGADGNGSDITLDQTWDDTSRLTGRTDDNGNTTQYAYDALNRLTSRDFPDCTQHIFTYDVHDNQLTMTDDSNGNLSVCGYDALNRLINNTITPGPGVSTDTTLEGYTYDGLSRLVTAADDDALVSRTHDSLSHVTSETLNGQATSSTFDGVGNKLSTTLPNGRVITRTYDVLDRINMVLDATAPADPLVGEYFYVGPERVQQRLFGNGTGTDYVYDGIPPNAPGDFGVRMPVVTAHFSLSAGGIIDDRRYNWDPMQNKFCRVDVRVGGPQITHTYVYDDAYRLTDAFANDPSTTLRTTSYTLDGVGNRTQVTGAPNPGNYFMDPAACTPADQQTNQYTTTPFDSRAYDPNGNLSTIDAGLSNERTLTYDYRDQLTAYEETTSGLTHTYQYDALGRRIGRVVDADGVAGGPFETHYFYDGWQVCEEQDPTIGTTATYVYGNYIDEVLQMQRGVFDYYYHSDDQHNVMLLTDAFGLVVERYEYDDYGRPVNPSTLTPLTGDPSTVANPYLYNGRRFDPETGYYYYRTRYLDPQAGRFITRDMLGSWGDPANHGSALAYCNNNPASSLDPWGRAKEQFDRTKPHVNTTTIKTSSSSSSSNSTSPPSMALTPGTGGLRMNKSDLIESIAKSTSSPKKKPREIVVVGSKVKDVVRSAGLRSDGELVQAVSESVKRAGGNTLAGARLAAPYIPGGAVLSAGQGGGSDPEANYRIKVRFPWDRHEEEMDETGHYWLTTVRPGIASSGNYALPEVDDEVLVWWRLPRPGGGLRMNKQELINKLAKPTGGHRMNKHDLVDKLAKPTGSAKKKPREIVVVGSKG